MKQKKTEVQLPKKTFWARLHEEKYLQVMALLGIAWMLVFNYIPMYGILIAFKKNFMVTTPLFSRKFFSTPWAAHGGFQHFLNFFLIQVMIPKILIIHSEYILHHDILSINHFYQNFT